jgi:hypothetical protein
MSMTADLGDTPAQAVTELARKLTEKFDDFPGTGA